MRIKIIPQIVNNIADLDEAQYEFVGVRNTTVLPIEKSTIQKHIDTNKLHFVINDAVFKRSKSINVKLIYVDGAEENYDFINPTILLQS